MNSEQSPKIEWIMFWHATATSDAWINLINRSKSMQSDVPPIRVSAIFARRSENITIFFLFAFRSLHVFFPNIWTVGFRLTTTQRLLCRFCIHRECRIACTAFFAALLLAHRKRTRFKFKQVSHESLLNYSTHSHDSCVFAVRVAGTV